jgi:hypothetical protein
MPQPTARQLHDVKAYRFARHSVKWIAAKLGLSVKQVQQILGDEGQAGAMVKP